MAYLPSTGEDVVGCGCTRPRLGQLRALLRSVLKLKKLLRVCSRRRSIQLQKRGIFAYQPSHPPREHFLDTRLLTAPRGQEDKGVTRESPPRGLCFLLSLIHI